MFNVGDLITGTSSNTYAYTNDESLCIVTEIRSSEEIMALIVAHNSYTNRIGDSYPVHPGDFKLCTLEDFIKTYPLANVINNLDVKLNETKSMEEKNKMELRMDKDKIGSYELNAEEREALRTEIKDLLDEYYYHPTDAGVNAILDEWIKNKGWMVNLFKKHPNYNGKFQIAFDCNYQRKCNTQALGDFGYWLERQANHVLKEIVLGKFTYGEVYEFYNKINSILYNISNIRSHGGRNILVDGRTEQELKAEQTKWYEKYREYNNSEEIYIDNCIAYSKESYHEKVGLYRISCLIRDYKESVADEYFAERVNKYLPKVKAVAGQKTSRIIGKICKLTGLDKLEDYNREYAKYCDAINPLAIKRHTVLSCHPIDYLTMSFGNSWASCHTVDKYNRRGMPNDYSGCYSSGTLSYMLDGSSFVYYTVDKAYNGNEYELQPKINRNMFHMGEDKLIQARVYPQSSDGEDGIYKQIREISQKVISDCLEVPNMWKNTSGTSVCDAVIDSYGTHYRDYTHFSNCNVSYLKFENSESKNMNYIIVGHDPICPCCGEKHEYQEAIECEDCYVDEYTCACCGARHDRSDMHEINGQWYCNSCCFYCEYHEEWESYPDDSIYVRDYGRVCDNALSYGDDFHFCESCDEYFYNNGDAIYTEDRKWFCDESCAESAGYRYVESDGWYKSDELYYCEECDEWVHTSGWNSEHDCCVNCVPDEDEEEIREAV